MDVVHKTGAVAVSEVDGKDMILDSDVTLTIDQAIETGLSIHGSSDKALTVVDGAHYQLAAEDLGKLKLDDFAGLVVWNSSCVNGKACWMDYEFNGDLSSTGKDTTSLSRDSDSYNSASTNFYGAELTADFAPNATEGYDGLYAGSHPWRNVSSYPGVWTCVIYGTLPQYDNAVLVAFGSSTADPKGYIALMTSDVENNGVKLVYANAAGTIVKEQAMTVPEAFTTPHLYLFTLDGEVLTVYLDGTKISTLHNEGGYTFGTGLQIASVHGGTPSPLLRFSPALFTDLTDDPRAKSCVINAMRLYDVRLAEKAIAALKAEFPFNSQAGRFTRTLDGAAANWVGAEVWTKGTESAEKPDADSNVEITTTAATDLSVNLTASASYASVTFAGSAAVTLTAGTIPVSSASTTINAPVVIKPGAFNIAGPMTIGESGSLTFDYSAYPITSVVEPMTIDLTGVAENYGTKVALVTPTEMASRTMTLVYDTSTESYKLEIALTRAEGDLYIPEGDVTLTNESTYLDGEGNSAFPFYPNDWLIVNHEQTVTIGENLTVAPKILVVAGGKLKVDFASGVTVGNLTVKVAAGGVYDINHYSGHKDMSHPIILAGGMLTNGGIAQAVTQRQYWQISLEADSFVDVTNTFGAVNASYNRHNFALNGYKLTKTGPGTYILRTANFVGGGTLEVQEGNIDLMSCEVPESATLNFVVAADATITVDNALAKSGTVKGAGTVIYTAGVNTSAIYQDTGWTGTIWIKNMVWDNWNLGRDGNSNTGAKIKLTGLYGYGDGDGCGAEVVLQDEGATKALTVTNGTDRTGAYFFNKVSGSGTFTWDTTVTTNVIAGRIYWLKNVGSFTGKLITGDYLQFSIGGTGAGELTPGAIKVAADATICAGNWEAKSISFAGTVNVKGAVHSVVATVREEPTNLPARITLLDEEGNAAPGMYALKVRTVVGGYQVYVSHEGFTIRLR